MSEIISIDSSVLISALGSSDVYAPDSYNFFKTIIAKKIRVIIPSLVMAETVCNLCRYNQKSAEKAYQMMNKFEVIDLNSDIVSLLLSKYRPTKLKTSDTIIAVTAAIHSATLVTWDRQLLTEGVHLCPVTSPPGFLKEQSLI